MEVNCTTNGFGCVTEANLNGFVNDEPMQQPKCGGLERLQVTHNVAHEEPGEFGHICGPNLKPVNWWGHTEHLMVVSIVFIMISNHFPGITYGGASQLGHPRGIDHERLDCCKVYQEGLIKRFAGTLAGVRP